MKDNNTFEKRLERLEDIVRSLETNPPSLKESITLYEEGKKLVTGCRQELEEAEQMVEKLS